MWIGISALTCVEVLELLVSLCYTILKRIKQPRANVIEVQASDSPAQETRWCIISNQTFSITWTKDEGYGSYNNQNLLKLIKDLSRLTFFSPEQSKYLICNLK